MKKFLSLLALVMLCVTGVKAEDETVFSANVTAKANVAFSTGTTEITSDNADLAGGKMYAISEQENDKNLIGKQGSYYLFCMTNNNTFFKVELDKALAAGDVISAKTYSRTDTELGLWLSTATSRPSECSTKLSIAQVETVAYEAFSDYTVAAGDGLEGVTEFYIYRETGKSTYFNEFTITRAAGSEEPVVTNKTIALVPGNWTADGATFAAYVWNADGNAWFPFVEASGAYATQIPDNYTGLIVARINPDGTDADPWKNVWNKTADINFTTVADGSIITITGWNESDYTITNPLQEAREKLTKIITMAEMLDAETLATEIASAKEALAGTDISAMETAANVIMGKALPIASSVIEMAKEFAQKYGYTEVSNAISAVEGSIISAMGGNMGPLETALKNLIAVAIPAATDAIGKIEGYAESLDNEALDTAIAQAKAALGSGNVKDIIEKIKALEEPFSSAAKDFVTKVASENIEDPAVVAALAGVNGAMNADPFSIVAFGDAIKNLIKAYNAYQLEQNPVYTVAGTADLTGYEWDTTKNEMKKNEETGLYEWTAKFITVTATQVPEFKVVKNYTTWYPEDGNWRITPEVLDGEGIYTSITITFNADSKEIGVTGVKRETPVYADNNVYFWESPDGYINENGGVAVHNNGGRVNYSQGGYYTISLNGKADYSSDVVTITLNEGVTLSKGDQIAITAFRNKNTAGSKSGAKLKFNDASNTTINIGDGLEFNNINTDAAVAAEFGEPNTITAVIPEAADGATTIQLTRSSTATNLFITKIEINRPKTENTYTATFTTNAGWGEVYAYAWTEGETTTEFLGAWPGTKLEATDGVYNVAITATEAPAFIIFNNGLGGDEKQQTENLVFEDGKAYEYNTPTTGISTVTVNAANDGQVYNLAGQKVQTMEKGLYIVNGKKVLMK